MGSTLARKRGEDDGEEIRHLTQRVAIVLVRLNASMLLNRAPINTPTEVDGIEKTQADSTLSYPNRIWPVEAR